MVEPRLGGRVTKADRPDLLLGEWACLGVLASGPAHGYAVARRFGKDGDLGRVWTMSRPMVYRCLDVLQERGLAVPVSPGTDDARGKTSLRTSPSGSRALDTWLEEPVASLRDVRTTLLIKLLLLEELQHDASLLLHAQEAMAKARGAELEAEIRASGVPDPVAIWRAESAAALQRTLQRIAEV